MNKQLENILKKINSYLDFTEEELHLVDLLLATFVSLKTERPSWIFITAPPSSGKSELISLFEGIPKVHFISNLTSKFLFSGFKKANGGYMIREVGEEGVLVFSDFTTVISKGSIERNTIFNQLRVIFDGIASLGTGITLKKADEWKGKVSILANVTESIEKIKQKDTDLGERFVYYNFFPTLKKLRTKTQVDNDIIKGELREDIKDFIEECRTKVETLNLKQFQKQYIFNCAEVIAWARTSVDRDGQNRSIEHVHDRERPYRLNNIFENLIKSLSVVNNSESRNKKILKTIVLSSMSHARMKIIEFIFISKRSHPIDSFVTILGVSESKVRRTVEDLCALKILEFKVIGKGYNAYHSYSLTNDFNELMKKVF